MPNHISITELQTIAQHAAQSRLFGLDAHQAFTLMLIAESEGLHPIQALKRYHVISGRPAMRADAMQAEFQRAGGTVEWIETTDTACEACFRHPTHTSKAGQSCRFTIEDARRAGLADKQTWKSYPAAMLRARVISTGIRMVLPGIVVGIYTPEEVGDFEREPARPVNPAPLPALISTTTDPPATETIVEVESGRPQTNCRRWMEEEISRLNDEWRNLCAMHQREYKPVTNLWQTINHLISGWIADGTLNPEQVESASGKRDKAKVGQILTNSWALDPGGIKSEVASYLEAKFHAAAADAEIPAEIGERAS